MPKQQAFCLYNSMLNTSCKMVWTLTAVLIWRMRRVLNELFVSIKYVSHGSLGFPVLHWYHHLYTKVHFFIPTVGRSNTLKPCLRGSDCGVSTTRQNHAWPNKSHHGVIKGNSGLDMTVKCSEAPLTKQYSASQQIIVYPKNLCISKHVK